MLKLLFMFMIIIYDYGKNNIDLSFAKIPKTLIINNKIYTKHTNTVK